MFVNFVQSFSMNLSLSMNMLNETANHVQTLPPCYNDIEGYQIASISSSFKFMNSLAACVFSGFITMTTVCLNSLTVLTFLRAARLRKTVSSYLVMILSMVDAGTGIFCYPTVTTLLATELINNPVCWVIHAQLKSFMVSGTISLSIVSTISTERYFGVVHPIFHRRKITKSKLLKFLFCFWCIDATVVVLDAFVTNQALHYFTTVSCVFFVLSIVFAHTKIAFVAARSNTRWIRKYGTTEGQDNTVEEILGERRRFLKELKRTKTCFLIALTYLACYLPTLILLGAMQGELSASTLFFVTPWCVLLVMCSSILNSFVFFWRSAPLRKEVKVVLRNICNSQVLKYMP